MDAKSLRENQRVKTITLLRDDEGEDCAANAGKFFLYEILK